jgi:hypothetical protein
VRVWTRLYFSGSQPDEGMAVLVLGADVVGQGAGGVAGYGAGGKADDAGVAGLGVVFAQRGVFGLSRHGLTRFFGYTRPADRVAGGRERAPV